MRYSRLFSVVAPCLSAVAQAIVAQQPTPPIRPLGAVIAAAPESFGGNSSIRPLSNGRVLINDPRGRRLLLFDSTLQHAVVVADTTSGTGNAYGSGLTGMVPFMGDSSLIRDQVTNALLVIDPMGKIARIIHVTGKVNLLISPFPPVPVGFDHAGRLVAREPSPFYLGLLPRDFVGDTLMVGPDSVPILREELTTRRLDTMAMLQAPRVRQAVTKAINRGSGRPALNPIPSGDDWTLMNDGTVAIVRVRDYHIDWVSPDRHVTSSPKIPVEWVRLTDSMKVAIMDSVRGPNRSADGNGFASGAPAMAYVAPSDLPDFRPPFKTDFARADADGNVWVRANQVRSVYDVIDRSGRRIDRVEIPAGATLVGFGPGVAYLTTNVSGGVTLSKARIR